MSTHSIQAIIEAGEYAYYGLRVDDRGFTVGDVLPDSGDWCDDVLVGELDGACAIECSDIPKALRLLKRYTGKQILLVGADSMLWGADQGEIILRHNPTVLAVWER